MEHKFISPSDGFVRCVVLSRQRVVNLPVDDLMNELLGKTTKKQTPFDRLENGNAEHAKIKPSIPLEVTKFCIFPSRRILFYLFFAYSLKGCQMDGME